MSKIDDCRRLLPQHPSLIARYDAAIAEARGLPLHGFKPADHPLVVAVGKDGRRSKLWWKGEEVQTALAVRLHVLKSSQIVFGPFRGVVNHPTLTREEQVAHRQKVIDEMKAAGFEVFVEA